MNILNFKIRNLDTDDYNEFKLGHERYMNHLKSTGLKDGDPLLKYFGYDFFHDGEIKDLQIFEGNRNINFSIIAPNIRPIDKLEYKQIGYLWAKFTCSFRNVVWYSMAAMRYDSINDPIAPNYKHSLEYRYGEIDSLTEEIDFFKSNYKDSEYFVEGSEFHSLIIELVPPMGFMGMIFTDVNVIPAEPLAWSQLVNSNKYEIPLFKFD